MEERKRFASLDLVRTLAMLSVVLLHVYGSVLPAGSRLGLVSRAFGFVGVPLFVVISGYLMLERSYDGDYMKKYLLRNLLPLVVAFEVWNVVFALLGRIPDLYWEIPFADTLRNALFAGCASLDELWFFPMMIALYLGLPIISGALKRFSSGSGRAYGLLILVLLVYSGTLLPTLVAMGSQVGLQLDVVPLVEPSGFAAAVWGGCVWTLYFVLGWIIRREGLRRVPTWGISLVLLSALLFHVGFVMRFNWWDTGAAYSYLPMVAAAVCIVELFVRAEKVIPDGLARVAEFVSERAFGVYIIHLWVINVLTLVLGSDAIVGLVNSTPTAVFALAAAEGVVVLVSLAIVELLCHLPLVRRWALLMK